MKTRKLSLALALVLVSTLVFGQDYSFKVLASKGANEIKSGETWQPLKTGTSLKAGDEVRIGQNAYLGLISAKGKPKEIREAGSFKVADIADMELIGIPHRIVIGERGLSEGKLEYKGRRDAELTLVDRGGINDLILGKLCAA